MFLGVYWHRTEDLVVRLTMRGELSQLGGFDALPLRATILPPDLHLNLGEIERLRDLRSLR